MPNQHLQEPVEKLHPLDADFSALLQDPGADLLADRLMDSLGGLSPLVCREAALFAADSVDARLEGQDMMPIANKLELFFRENLTRPTPSFYAQADGTPKQFAFCPIRQYGGCEQAKSFGALLDMYYTVRDRKDAMRQKSQAVRKTVQNLCTRLTRKLAIQEKELEATYDRERLRQLGDIVTANIHRIEKGKSILQAEDFYDEEMKVIDIPISPILSPQQNAAKFYKDYTRMKNAQKELTHQLELGREELSYLESVLDELTRADSEQALEEIRQELQAGGYVRRDSGKRKMKQSKLAPMRFESTDGIGIYVGRNNRQNDELTFKLASKGDIWLHAQKVHGSHVIIAANGRAVPDDTITQAAQLAAYHSELRLGQNVPVDVTPADTPTESTEPTEATEATAPKKSPLTTIHIKAAGDLNVTNSVVNAGLAPNGFNYTNAFIDVASTMADADLTVMNFEGNIYEQPMRIEFIDFLRPETKFSSVNELILQIQKDKEATEQRLSK